VAFGTLFIVLVISRVRFADVLTDSDPTLYHKIAVVWDVIPCSLVDSALRHISEDHNHVQKSHVFYEMLHRAFDMNGITASFHEAQIKDYLNFIAHTHTHTHKQEILDIKYR
jgi:hypothetical protein